MRQVRKELGKLIAYAKGHGLNVYFQSSRSDASGAWSTDGKDIYVYEKTPLKQYLVLLHELAHNRQFLVDGKSVPFKIEKALSKELHLEADEILDKKYRKIIYETEKNDAKHQLDIHYETHSSVPVNIIKLEIELDLWNYKWYYLKGEFPLLKDSRAKRKELRRKYGL